MSNLDSNKQFGTYTLGQNHIVETVWLKYKNSPEGRWITKINSVVKLYKFLKRVQPKHILELGTGIGCSTEIMAFTCPNASIYTVEQNPKCIKIAKKLIPERFQERIYFKESQVAVLKPIYEVNPFMYWAGYHTSYDWRNYDFIYVDGPGPFVAKRVKQETKEFWEALVDLPGGDIILLLHKMKEGTLIYVESRQLMVHYYERYLKHYLETVEAKREYTVFRRTAESLAPNFSDFKNSDTHYQHLLTNKYFDE